MPIRTCIACRTTAEQASMTRLVREGDVVVDGTAPRKPGRGAYLHPHCIELAVQRRAVVRAFRGADLDPATLDALRSVAS